MLLLGYKKRGLGADLYNAAGGKIEPEETILAAAIRETQEEFCVTLLNPKHRGVLNIFNRSTHGPFAQESQIDLFVASEFEGTPSATEEMEPAWFNIEKIPFDSMIYNQRVYLPILLNTKEFFIKCDFYHQGSYLVNFEISGA